MWWAWVGSAWATWSIVAVDPETQQVGVAGATCAPMVWMIGEVVPGHGAVAAQYASNRVVGGGGAAFTGDEVEATALSASTGVASVQGNTLVSEAVVDDTLAAFEASDDPLAWRLVAAMEAGAAAGGDARCAPEKSSHTAFVFVADPDDRPSAPTVAVRTSRFGNGDDAVSRLRDALTREEGGGCDHTGGAAPGWGLLALALGYGARARKAASAL